MSSAGRVSADISERRESFVKGLYSLGYDLESGVPARVARARRVLARVRRSVSDPHYLLDALQLVDRHAPEPSEKDVWMFIAVLFSLHPRPASGGRRRPLGIAMKESGTGTSADARLRQLLTSDWSVLQNRLRQAVRMLQQQKIALDYIQLLDDLVELHQAPVGSARAHRVHLRWTEQFLSGWYDRDATAPTS